MTEIMLLYSKTIKPSNVNSERLIGVLKVAVMIFFSLMAKILSLKQCLAKQSGDILNYCTHMTVHHRDTGGVQDGLNQT